MRSYGEFEDHLEHVLRLAPKATAIYSGTRTYTWQQVATAIRAMDECFSELSLPTGSQIGVVAHNSAAAVTALLAITRAGHCFVTFNPMHSGEKIGAELASLRLPLLIAAPDDLADQHLEEAVSRTGSAVIVASDTDTDIALNFLPGNSDAAFSKPLDNIAALMQSSGTTGAPKRIPLRYPGLLHPISDQMPEGGSSAVQDKEVPAIVASPLAHIGGLFFSLKSVIDARPQILMGRFDVQTWSDAVQRYQLKLGHLVPATVKMIFDADVQKETLASLKAIICGSAALRPDIQEAFEARYGVPLLVVYGATEFAGGVAGWSLPLHREFMPAKLGSVGRAFPGAELRIVDAGSGEEVPRGEEGILEIRSVQSPSGKDTWVATTDIAVLDEDDFLWIRGRTDAAINRGGFKVIPTDVEKVLNEHADVEEAVVVALDDDRLGQVPAALLQPRDGASEIDLESVQAHARKSLAPYQVPARFLVAATIPRNASLKPDLPAIRTLFKRQQ